MRVSNVRSIISAVIVSAVVTGCAVPNPLQKNTETASQVEQTQPVVEEQPVDVNEMPVNITVETGKTITSDDVKELINEQLLVQGIDDTVAELYMSCDDSGDTNVSEVVALEGKHLVSTLFTLTTDTDTKTSKFVYEGVGETAVTDDTKTVQVSNEYTIIPNASLDTVEQASLEEYYSGLKEVGGIENGVTFALADGYTPEGAGFTEDVEKTYYNVLFSDEFTIDEETAYLQEHTEIEPLKLSVHVTDIDNEVEPRMALITVADQSGKEYNFGLFLQTLESTLGLSESKYIDLYETPDKSSEEASTESSEEASTESSEDAATEGESTVEEESLNTSENNTGEYTVDMWKQVVTNIGYNTNNFEDLFSVEFVNDPLPINKEVQEELSEGATSADEMAEQKTTKTGLKSYKSVHPELYVWPELSATYSRWDWRITDATTIIGTITLSDGSIIPAEQTNGENGYSFNFASNSNNYSSGNQTNQNVEPEDTTYLVAGANRIIISNDSTYGDIDKETSTTSVVKIDKSGLTYLLQVGSKETVDAMKTQRMFDDIPEDFDISSETATGVNGLQITTYSIKWQAEDNTEEVHPYMAVAKYDDNNYIICYCSTQLLSQYSTNLFDILSNKVEM